MTESAREHVFRTPNEIAAAEALAQIFATNHDPTHIKLENFPKYVRRQHLKRFIAMYEIFKKVLPVKGSVVECGVFRGFGLMSWAKLSTILEPENLTRRIYGFDTFDGFPEVGVEDANQFRPASEGDLRSDSYSELLRIIDEYDRDRFLGHIPKVEIVKGDIAQTVPKFLETHPHLVVSLLFIDCDLYDPTLVALKNFVPRMPRGSLLVFDELDNPIWPGETRAVLDQLGLGSLRLQRFEWDPYISFAEIGS